MTTEKREPAVAIDLNSDIAESFGPWPMGDDESMLSLVSSANIACGFHAGDPRGIRATVRNARERGVTVGAHVGYRDLAGFGRRALDVATDDLVAETIYQIGALHAIARAEGTTVRYVKPHGALYNTIVRDERQARAVVEAVRAVDPTLVLLGLPNSAVLRIAEAEGIPIAREAFADRGYLPDGTLAPRGSEGAVLHDSDAVASRVVSMVLNGTIEAVDGSPVQVSADSICVHGDTPGAVEMATKVRAALAAADTAVRPFVAS